MAESSENRNFKRVALEYNVEYSVLSGFDKLNLFQSRTLDFSLSGTRIETGEQLKQGDQISVRIEVPDLQSFWLDDGGNRCYNKTVVMCFGTVRWVEDTGEDKHEAGIQFSGMTTRDKVYLTRLFEEAPKTGQESVG
ncbi:MAG: PilZ domain-containing protein [Candidatus Glassbacteria bacterium]|nr:PilZ domain-containing protein [Candidatus Glassbacteria bacterium]